MARIAAGDSADLMMINDVVNFTALTKADLFQPMDSAVISSRIPMQFRDSGNRWFGLSYKARTIMYNPHFVKPTELSDYEGLADPKWKGKLCLRNSGKSYNRALVASLMYRHGVEGAKKVIEGWVANLATPVFDTDSKLLEAMALSTCTVGIADTFYLGRILEKDAEYPARAFWANQEGSGVHVNIAGMAQLKISKNLEQTKQLMEYLVSDSAVRSFADFNFEFPTVPGLHASTLVGGWGDFKVDSTPVSLFGELSDAAAELSLSAGYL